jgi:hypothetical protein
MKAQAELKSQILDLLDEQDPHILIGEADKLRLRALVDEIAAYTQVTAPIREQEKVQGVWDSLFASFGAKHSDEKPIRHTTSLAFQSFGNLPMVTVHVTGVQQEIHAASRAYNNVIFVENEDRSASGIIVMRGTYDEDEENPQRYAVQFSNVSLIAPGERPEDTLREQFGIDPGVAISVDFRPPRLHSDIVYLDDDMRINVGSLGGFYVMRRLDQTGVSIPP